MCQKSKRGRYRISFPIVICANILLFLHFKTMKTPSDDAATTTTKWAIPHFGVAQTAAGEEAKAVRCDSGSGGGPYLPASAIPLPLFTVDLSKTIGSEYAGMVEDIIRMISLQLTIQVMLYFGNAIPCLFTEELLVLSFYIVLGVAFFWLVVKTLVAFK